MSYQSPIEVIQTQMRNQIEGNIYQAVMNVGVNVDKEKLLKALHYGREQYQKGYKDRDDQIVRCKDCKHWLSMNRFDPDYHPGRGECELNCWVRDFDWFCADGKRRDNND